MGAMTNFRAEDMPGAVKIAYAKGSKPKGGKKSENTDPDAVPEGTAQEVKDWAGEDAERVQRALDAENAAEQPRKTLIEDLEKTQANLVPVGNIGDVEEWVGDDPERAQRALDQENASDSPRSTLIESLERTIAGPEDDDTTE